MSIGASRIIRLVRHSCSLPTLFLNHEDKALIWYSLGGLRLLGSSSIFAWSKPIGWELPVLRRQSLKLREAAQCLPQMRFVNTSPVLCKQKDYYAVLGVSRSSKQGDIKKAYYTLAKKYHPDVNSDGKERAQVKFQEVQEAYEVLGDDAKRREYDQHNGAFRNPFQQDFRSKSSSPKQNSRQRKTDNAEHYNWSYDFTYSDDIPNPKMRYSKNNINRPHKHQFDLFGMLNNMFRDFQNLADEAFKFAGDVVVSMEEAATGTEKQIFLKVTDICKSCKGVGRSMHGKEKCSVCKGTGNYEQSHNIKAPCFVCYGTGHISSSKVCLDCRGSGNSFRKEKIKIKIPPGVGHHQRIEVRTPSGPATIRVLIKKSDAGFGSAGLDVHTESVITSKEATVGVVKRIPTHSGQINVHIPPGTWTGRMIELKGQGLQKPNSKERGSLIVHIKIKG
ncbi:unnamed protein product [Orchesella dallaii]|uniref:Uncharacterized protein n=1 Tax=Orchesella dallaii TaxID=48710 RepID=A0ABP1Q7J1_9HEXA